MNDKQLYQQILGISSPWHVAGVEIFSEQNEILVRIDYDNSITHCCPICNSKSKKHDTRIRRWRHLDTCQMITILEAQVPRVKCAEHGVHQINIPWAENNSSFTNLFEAVVINWLKETSISAVSRQLKLSWDVVERIRNRAVDRGLSRRGDIEPEHVAIDETSEKKGHSYLTIVSEGSTVLYVGEGRTTEVVDKFWESIKPKSRSNIKSVSMDLWAAFRASTKKYVPDWEKKICLDRFHVAGYFGKAIDTVRRIENKELLKNGDKSLMGMKYQILRSDSNVDNRTSYRRKFREVAKSVLKTAKAWAMKEIQHKIWNYKYMGIVKREWECLLSWMSHCKIKPMVKLAKSLKKHLWMIFNAIRLKVSNGCAESNNSRIQKIKKIACGYRNSNSFKYAIYFHLGDLELYH